MSDLSDKALDHRTKAVIDMVGRPGEYEPPKSRNMLSHLTSDRAFNDYQKETTRKLIRQQEELLRNLTKVRRQMELEEDEIGKTRDYYSGSGEEKFGHTLDKAEKLRRQREKKRTVDREENGLTIDTHLYSVPNSHVTYTSTREQDDDQSRRFSSDIRRLKDQVHAIANRYNESDGAAPPNKYLYEDQYFPGQSYFMDETPAYCYMPADDIERSMEKLPTILQADGHMYKLVKID